MSETRVIAQNVRQVREKNKFSGLRHFVTFLASHNRDFWLQMAFTQRRSIKDVQILAFEEKCSMLPPNVKDMIKTFWVGKDTSKVAAPTVQKM